MSRARPALRPPRVDLTDFPVRVLTPRLPLYRAHRRDLGPWFFGSSGAGRFDLRDGRGTCYLAFDARTAFREVVGAELHALGIVPIEFLTTRVLSQLHLVATTTVADLCHERAADFGVTREIHTLTPYSVPQAWAAELALTSDGVAYQTRFTTGTGANGLALFGQEGPHDLPADDAPVPLTTIAAAAGVTVERIPRTVRIVRPPRH